MSQWSSHATVLYVHFQISATTKSLEKVEHDAIIKKKTFSLKRCGKCNETARKQ